LDIWTTTQRRREDEDLDQYLNRVPDGVPCPHCKKAISSTRTPPLVNGQVADVLAEQLGCEVHAEQLSLRKATVEFIAERYAGCGLSKYTTRAFNIPSQPHTRELEDTDNEREREQQALLLNERLQSAIQITRRIVQERYERARVEGLPMPRFGAYWMQQDEDDEMNIRDEEEVQEYNLDEEEDEWHEDWESQTDGLDSEDS
jgi:hypothetical protein